MSYPQRLLFLVVVLAFVASCSKAPETSKPKTSANNDEQARNKVVAESTAEVPPVSSPSLPITSEKEISKPSASTPATVSEDEAISLLEERETRFAVGDVVPNFRLQDQGGTQRTLDSLLSQGKVALVFYRSADW